MIWPVLKPGDWAAVFLLAVILLGVVAGYLGFPFGLLSNWGFDRAWRCSYSGSGEPVCVKEPPANPAKSPSSAK